MTVTDAGSGAIRPAWHEVVRDLAAVLEDTIAVLDDLGDDGYRGDGLAVGLAAPGAHFRHILDHVGACLIGLDDGRIDYERRHRGGLLERDRAEGVRTGRELLARLHHLEAGDLAAEVEVCKVLNPDAPAYRFASTAGREFAFVLHHTIHHNAIIARSLRDLGHEVPEGFGFAPSTTAFLRRRGDAMIDSAD